MNAVSANRLPAELAALPRRCLTLDDDARSGCHATVFLDAAQLLAAARILYDHAYFIEDLAGVDTAEGIMLVYHFDRYAAAQRLALRVMIPHADPRVPSIAVIFSGADWHERECFDFFGVVFDGHPDLKPLLLPDDLTVRPLLKDKARRSLHALLPLGQLVQARE